MASSAVSRELEIIRKQNHGILRPVDVVSFARDPQTALHAEFEWDDDKAAEQYRLEQARQIIRCAVRVIGDGRPPIRAYVSLLSDRQAGDSYRDVFDVMSTPSLRDQLLAQALREAESWRLRYEHLVELQSVCREIAKAQKRKRREAG